MKNLALALVVLLSGCSLNVSSTDTHKNINGKSPDDYYNQFLYRKDGSGYRYLSSSFARLANSELYASVSLVLYQDHTYKLLYSEHKKDAPDIYSQTFSKTLSGTWAVDDLSIKLSGDVTGKGSGLNYNGAEAVVLKVDKDIQTAGLIEIPLTLSFVYATRSPE